MGDFTLGSTGNANIGLTSVEFSAAPAGVNSTTAKGGSASLLYGGATAAGGEPGLLQPAGSPRPIMQEAVVAAAVAGGEPHQQQPAAVSSPAGGCEDGGVGPQNSAAAAAAAGALEAAKKEQQQQQQHPEVAALGNGLIDKLAEQQPSLKAASMGAGGFDTSNTSALWSNATCGMEDAAGYLQHGGINGGGLPFQNYVPFNSGRRAITATHNFRQQQAAAAPPPPQQPMQYKQAAAGYGWAAPGAQQQQGTWSSGASAPWNRGRSVPNLNPMQGGMVNRKPSPTGFGQPANMLISPVKFRRSTSYPGKGMFTAQPPTFEITNMDDTRDLLPYQVRVCCVAQLACTSLTHALHVHSRQTYCLFYLYKLPFLFLLISSMCLLY